VRPTVNPAFLSHQQTEIHVFSYDPKSHTNFKFLAGQVNLLSGALPFELTSLGSRKVSAPQKQSAVSISRESPTGAMGVSGIMRRTQLKYEFLVSRTRTLIGLIITGRSDNFNNRNERAN
jgi:hypothetical protein